MEISRTDYDFAGWATKANMRCSDGRTIMRNAFADNDGATVPLVWNHQHNDPANVLGHAQLENRPEGVYAYCKFNNSESGIMGRELVKSGDVNQLSIYANKLKQQGGNVLHGDICELSLVLKGANPGACIKEVLCHSDDSDNGAVIYTGEDIELIHSDDEEEIVENDPYDFTEEQEEFICSLLEKAMEEAAVASNDTVEHSDKSKEDNKMASNEKTVQDVLDELTEEQQEVVYALIGHALGENEEVKHHYEGDDEMYHNVFDREESAQGGFLSHAEQAEILELAKKPGVGTFKQALAIYAEDHADVLAHADTRSRKGRKNILRGLPELLVHSDAFADGIERSLHFSRQI